MDSLATPIRPSPPSPAKGEQTRQAIVQAAIVRFGRDGFRSTSVADVARDAEVGGTVTYAYFPNKEALFLAALDEDAAAVIQEGVTSILDDPDPRAWRASLFLTLSDAIEHHPLARRVLAGLEPHVTARFLELPALAELRETVAGRLRTEQATGLVRPDIDPVKIGSGAVVIIISLMMAMLQTGRDGAVLYGDDIMAVFEAALDAAPPAPNVAVEPCTAEDH